MRGGAAHVLLHVEHAALGLDVEAAGVEAHALADQRDLGMARIAPGDVDEPRRRARRARPTAWMSGKFCSSRSSPTIARTVAPWRSASVRAAVFELGRPHVVGRRVDEVARERRRPRRCGVRSSPSTLPGSSSRMSFSLLLAVAREAVAAEREGERREPRIVRRIGEAVGAGREEPGERARPEQVLAPVVGGSSPNRTPASAAVRARQQEVAAGLRLEAGGVGEGALRASRAARAARARSRR